MPIIEAKVAQGSTSFGWMGHVWGINNPQLQYNQCVNPADPMVHTQGIEARGVLLKLLHLYGTNKEILASYLYQYKYV